MLESIYKALKERLETIPDVDEVDYFLGQYLQAEGGSVLYSDEALFIEFLPIPWQSLRGGVQKAVLNFRIHAVSSCLYDDENRLIGTGVFDHMGLVTKVFQSLQNFRAIEPSGNVLFESVVRIRTEPNHDLDLVMVTVQEFQATIFDYSAIAATTTKNNVALNVTTDIKTSI